MQDASGLAILAGITIFTDQPTAIISAYWPYLGQAAMVEDLEDESVTTATPAASTALSARLYEYLRKTHSRIASPSTYIRT